MDGQSKKMLDDELEICQALNHPHIVRFVEKYEDNKYIMIVMELMEAGNVSLLGIETNYLFNDSSSTHYKPPKN